MVQWTCNSTDRVSVFGTENRGSNPFKSILLLVLFCLNTGATTPQMHNTAGLALYYQGRYAESFTEFLAALKKDPNNTTAHFNLGRIFEKQGKFEDAFIQYQRVLSLDPVNQGAKSGFERLRRFEKRPEIKVRTREEELERQLTQETDQLKQAEARNELLSTRLRQIQELFDQKNHSAAYDLIVKTKSLFPGSGELLFLHARYAFIQNQFPAAVDLTDQAIKLGVAQEDLALYLKALSYESLGDFVRAEAALKAALALAPSNSVYYERLGVVQKRQGKEVDAWEQFRRGVDVNPGAVQTRVQLNRLSRELSLKTYNDGKLAFESRDYARAKELLTRAIEFGELTPEMRSEAQSILKMTEYWVQKAQRITEVRENQRQNTQEINLRRDLEFSEVVNSVNLYTGEYVSWSGRVIHIEQKSGFYEILVDTDDQNDFQEDLVMGGLFVVQVKGVIPDDRRLSYLGSAEVMGKLKEPAYIRNPFNKNTSSRRQPVILLTEGKFQNRDFGSGFLRVFPEAGLF